MQSARSYDTEFAVKEKLKEVIAKELEIAPALIEDKTRFIEDLGIDSLSGLEMVFVIENEFGIVFSNEESMMVTCLESASHVTWQKLSTSETKTS